MKKTFATMSAALFVASGASAQVLYDNGDFVTHPGQGAGGLDVSMCSVDPLNLAGSNARQIAPDPHFRIADDFTVTGNWVVNQIVTHGYETNWNVPGWTGANINVWDRPPNDPGRVLLGTSTTVSVAQTNVYRVFNGAGNLANTARRVNTVTFEMGGLALGPGTYWIDWQLVGGTTGWANYVMEPNPSNPNEPITVLDNGLQMTVGSVWQPIAGFGAETPFRIIGTDGSGGCPWEDPTCPADWNGDGSLDGADFFAFLDDFVNQQPCADINGDGEWDSADFFRFLDDFVTSQNNGC